MNGDFLHGLVYFNLRELKLLEKIFVGSLNCFNGWNIQLPTTLFLLYFFNLAVDVAYEAKSIKRSSMNLFSNSRKSFIFSNSRLNHWSNDSFNIMNYRFSSTWWPVPWIVKFFDVWKKNGLEYNLEEFFILYLQALVASFQLIYVKLWKSTYYFRKFGSCPFHRSELLH